MLKELKLMKRRARSHFLKFSFWVFLWKHSAWSKWLLTGRKTSWLVRVIVYQFIMHTIKSVSCQRGHNGRHCAQVKSGAKPGETPHHLPDKSSPETNGQHTGNIPNNRPATSSTTLSKNPKASSIQSLRIRTVPIWEWDWCRNELTMVPFPGITMKRKRNSNDNANQSRLNNQLV